LALIILFLITIISAILCQNKSTQQPFKIHLNLLEIKTHIKSFLCFYFVSYGYKLILS
jgi:hypothetical protein